MIELHNRIFMPLQGPGAQRPKAPAVGGWQSPGYKGLTLEQAFYRYEASAHTQWFGMRTDDMVVIDCDSAEAVKLWLTAGDHLLDTFVRKTPRGFHLLYQQTPGSPDGPYTDVLGEGSHVDIRSGRTAQIAWFAPNYRTLKAQTAAPFEPEWLPKQLGHEQNTYEAESWDEIPDGRGNNTMAAFAGAFRKQGMSALAIAKCLGAINRICMTESPMSTTEIVEIAKSVGRYKPMPDIDIEVVDG